MDLCYKLGLPRGGSILQKYGNTESLIDRLKLILQKSFISKSS